LVRRDGGRSGLDRVNKSTGTDTNKVTEQKSTPTPRSTHSHTRKPNDKVHSCSSIGEVRPRWTEVCSASRSCLVSARRLREQIYYIDGSTATTGSELSSHTLPGPSPLEVFSLSLSLSRELSFSKSDFGFSSGLLSRGGIAGGDAASPEERVE
jgi:hypothetical protein